MAIALQFGLLDSDTKRPWNEDSQKMFHLMMGQFDRRTETLDLLGGAASQSKVLELESNKPLPSGWEKFLDLQSGAIYYVNCITGAKTLDGPSKRNSDSSFPFPSNAFESVVDNDVVDKPTPASVTAVKMSAECDLLKEVQHCTTEENLLARSLEKSRDEIDHQIDCIGSIMHASTACPENKNIKESLTHAKPMCPDNVLDLKLNLSMDSLTSLNSLKEEKPSACIFQTDAVCLSKQETPRTSAQPESFQSGFCHARCIKPHPLLTSSSSTTFSCPFLHLKTSTRPIGKEETSMRLSGKQQRTDTMVIGGCPRCLMYVMLSKADPTCPKCKCSALLDFPSSKKMKLR
eukprot:c14631_g1_i1 orf=350-1390(-)